MFYSNVVLAKKGSLGSIWLAAHWDKKLKKTEIFNTDIIVCVDSIINPSEPLALRVRGHLLLGLVRILKRKVNYLFNDCNDAMVKIKMAFRPGEVDLPLNAQIAPNSSITIANFGEWNINGFEDFEIEDIDVGALGAPEQWTSFGGEMLNLSREADITLDSTPRRNKRRRDSSSTPIVASQEKWVAFEGFGDDETSNSGSSIEVERARKAVDSTPQRSISFDHELMNSDRKDGSPKARFEADNYVEHVGEEDMMLPPSSPMNMDSSFNNQDHMMDVEMNASIHSTGDAMRIDSNIDGDIEVIAPSPVDSLRMRPLTDSDTESITASKKPNTQGKAASKKQRGLMRSKHTEMSSKALKSRINDASDTLRSYKRPRLMAEFDFTSPEDKGDDFILTLTNLSNQITPAPPGMSNIIQMHVTKSYPKAMHMDFEGLNLDLAETDIEFPRNDLSSHEEKFNDNILEEDMEFNVVGNEEALLPMEEFEFEEPAPIESMHEDMEENEISINESMLSSEEPYNGSNSVMLKSFEASVVDKSEGGISNGVSEDKLDQRTSKMLSVVRKELKKSSDNSLNYQKMSKGSTKLQAAACFFEILQLKTLNFVDVEQNTPYGNIEITAGPNFNL